MIIVEDTRGGYTLRREEDPPQETLFIATSELPALLAELIARESSADIADEWDTFAFLCGNDQIMAVRS